MGTLIFRIARQRAKGEITSTPWVGYYSEILELTVADNDVMEEIHKADEYAERLQLALIDLERVLKESKAILCLWMGANQKAVLCLRVGINQKAVNQDFSDNSR